MTEQKQSRARIVRKAIESIDEKLETDATKPMLADPARLLEIAKELDADESREVRVRWEESATTNSLRKQ